MCLNFRYMTLTCKVNHATPRTLAHYVCYALQVMYTLCDSGVALGEDVGPSHMDGAGSLEGKYGGG